MTNPADLGSHSHSQGGLPSQGRPAEDGDAEGTTWEKDDDLLQTFSKQRQKISGLSKEYQKEKLRAQLLPHRERVEGVTKHSTGNTSKDC